MRPSPPALLPCLLRRRAVSRARPHPAAAFSLVGLSAAVFVASIIAALAVPALQQRSREARAAATANDLRAFAAAFQSFAQQNGDWPAASARPGELPPGLANHPVASAWQGPAPIGGRYMWAANSRHRGERYRAALVISSGENNPVSTDRRQLQAVDTRLDDGDLESGKFRLGFRHQPVFVLEH